MRKGPAGLLGSRRGEPTLGEGGEDRSRPQRLVGVAWGESRGCRDRRMRRRQGTVVRSQTELPSGQ